MLLLLRSPLLLEGISTGACDDVPAACLIKILIIIWSNDGSRTTRKVSHLRLYPIPMRGSLITTLW
jgi:hypothetical protein